MNLTIFKYKTDSKDLKSGWKKWCHLSGFHVSFSKKSKAIMAIYVYASESSRFALLENCIGYYAMA